MPVRLFLLVLVAPLAAADEPARMARMTIGNEAYNVPLGKSFAVRIGGERVTIKIEPDEHLLFSAEGIEFLYPQRFRTTDTGDDPAVAIWALEGESAAVMLQRYDASLDPKSLLGVLVTNIVDQYTTEGTGAPKQQTVKLRGLEQSYDGQQVRARVAQGAGGEPAEVVQNVFTFANAEGVFALIVQDTRPEGAKDSDEYTAALRLLGESLKTGPAPKPGTGKASQKR
jgi:hypothetical protein